MTECDKGDAALCKGEFFEAINLYTKAINNDKTNEVLYLKRAFGYNLIACHKNIYEWVIFFIEVFE